MEPIPTVTSGTDEEDHETNSSQESQEDGSSVQGTQKTPLWKGLGIGRSYGDLVHTITADSMDNFNTLTPILRQCPNLHTLSVTRWNRELHVFREAFPLLSKLQNLSVTFFNPVDLNVFLTTLSSSSAKSPKEILAEGPVRMTTTLAEEKVGTLGLVSLRSLDIKNRVSDTNYIRWKVFKNTLDRLPSLERLALTKIGFLGGKDVTENTNIADQDAPVEFVANTNGPVFANANTSTILGTGPHFQGVHEDEDDYDEDDEEEGDDGDQARSFESGTGESSRTYPNLRSLALSFCYCPVTIMLDLDRIFPKLTSLEVNKCRNTWLHVFEPDPLNPTSHLGIPLATATAATITPSTTSASTTTTTTTTTSTTTATVAATIGTTGNGNGVTIQTTVPRVPFPDLTHLKLVEQYEGNEDLIHEMVKARPGLLSLETHQISLNLNTLLPTATFCSDHQRFFNRFSLSYCWSNPQTRRDYERLFEAPFLSRAKHLYIQQVRKWGEEETTRSKV